MSLNIPEADWKVLRRLHAAALERFSARILEEIRQAASDPDRSAHERFLAASRILDHRRKQMAQTFDDPRRSVALMLIAEMVWLDLVTEDDLSGFSPETRVAVRTLTTRPGA